MTRKNDPQTIAFITEELKLDHFLWVKKLNLILIHSVTDSDLPCKIVLCFVKAKDKNGDYHTNPFDLVNRKKFLH
jgi:hypothetical protein